MERELRIAPVMTGGTSLAVWMGGVTAELYRMTRAPIDGQGGWYERLLTLTDTTPVVDVVTGTSAGGLNGSLLAAATAWRISTTEFFRLRTTWMKAADLEGLMRRPSAVDPPSLLQGDAYFAPQLAAVLAGWHDKRPAQLAKMDLVTTYTSVKPNPRHRTDDFGESMNEVTYAGTLRFVDDHFAPATIVDKLATASRTSASIPGVFEPSFLACTDAAATQASRPNFNDHVPIEQKDISRWAVDGGVVVNLPLSEALVRIFNQSSHGRVRRVALYVCPTPTADTQATGDRWADQPNLRQSIGTVVSAPRAEGIANDIDAIRTNNADVQRQRGARERLGLIGAALDTAFEAPSHPGTAGVFDSFRRLRAQASIEDMLAALRQQTGGRMQVDESALAASLLQPRIELLPARIDDLDSPGRPGWAWGISPVEHAISIGLELVNRAFELLPAGTHAKLVRKVSTAKARLHAAREQTEAIRRKDAAFWALRIRQLPANPTSDQIVDFSEQSYQIWPNIEPDPVQQAAVLAELRAAHTKVASILMDIAPVLRGIAVAQGAVEHTGPVVAVTGAAPARSDWTYSWRRERTEAAQNLLGELDLIAPKPVPGGSFRGTVSEIQHNLLKLHVIQIVLVGRIELREQSVELMQVSWNSPDYLTDRQPGAKLTGPELARLGAFLKPSWRANDWLWGRLDGAARLVQLLLDPGQLRNRELKIADVLTALTEGGASVGTEWDDIRRELCFLENDGIPTPKGLPKTAAYVARQLQAEIAADELPRVADAVLASNDIGARDPDHGEFVNSVRSVRRANGNAIPLAEAKPLLAKLHIGEETVDDELGSDLTARLLSRGSGVAVNMLTAPTAGIPVAKRALRPLRAPLQAINAVISLITNSSPLARGLTALLLAGAGALVAVRLAGVAVAAPVLVFATAIVVGVFVWSLARSRHWLIMVGFVLFGGAVGLVALGPDLHSVVYSAPPPGVVTRVLENQFVALDDGGTIRVVDGAEKTTQDVRLGQGSTVELKSAAGRAELRTPAGPGTERWKSIGFVGAHNVLRYVTGLIALGLFVRALALWGMPRLRLAPLLLAVVLAGITWFEPPLAALVLTGTPGTSPTKDWLVSADLKLPVLLVVVVGVSLLVGIGVDQWVARVVPHLRTSRSRRV